MSKWLRIAWGEHGEGEIPGKQHNDRIIEYHASTSYKATKDEVPWCSSFTSWVMERAGIRSTRSAPRCSW